MPSSGKLVKRYENIISSILKALLLQRQALDRRDEEAVVMYSGYIRIGMEDLASLKKVIKAVDPGLFSAESEREKVVSGLLRSNMKGIEEMLGEINRQILSVRLLKKGNSLYSSVSKPEHIDILQ